LLLPGSPRSALGIEQAPDHGAHVGKKQPVSSAAAFDLSGGSIDQFTVLKRVSGRAPGIY
jgi:hypothetical protein